MAGRFHPRQAAVSSSAVANATTSLFSSINIFPTATPTPTTLPEKRTTTQLVLEWVIALVAVAILIFLVFLRYTYLRRQGNRRPTFSTMFARDEGGRPHSPDNARPFRHSIRHPLPQHLVPSSSLHAAIRSQALFTIPTLPTEPERGRGRRGVRGAETDEGGRRAGAGEEGDEKDALPAYEMGKQPPRYVENTGGGGHVEMQDLAGVRTRSERSFSLSPSPSRAVEGEGERGDVTHVIGENEDEAEAHTSTGAHDSASHPHPESQLAVPSPAHTTH